MSTDILRLRETVLITDAFHDSNIETRQKSLKSISDRCTSVATRLQVKFVRDVDLYVLVKESMLRVDLRRFWTNSLVDETVILNASTRKESFAEASRLLFDTLRQLVPYSTVSLTAL
jgi:hypothetical protein